MPHAAVIRASIARGDARFPRCDLIVRTWTVGGEALCAGFIDKTGVRDDQPAVMPSVYSLIVIEAGRGVFIDAAGHEHSLSTGDAFERVPGRRQGTRLDPTRPWRERCIALGPRLSTALLATGVIAADDGPCWRAPRDAARRLSDFHTRLATAEPTQLPSMATEAMALIVSLRPTPVAAPMDDAQRLHRWLSEDPLGRRDLTAWCAQHGAQADNLRKIFQRRFGESPMAFRLRLRMERACALLRHGGLTVAAVAQVLGYATTAAFATQFHRMIGKPPARWRDHG